MTDKQEQKPVSIKDKHSQIMKHFDLMEKSILGKNQYANPIFFWDDLHKLNEMIKDFMTHYFNSLSTLEKLQNQSLFADINAINLKIRLS